MKRFFILLLVSCIGFPLCARRVSKFMTQLQVGMTTEQVVKIMGTPESVSTINSCVYYNYLDQRMDPIVMYMHETWYYVRFINGLVDSFGQKGDFDSTKDDKQVIDINISTNDESSEKNQSNIDALEILRKLKIMLEEGLITEEDYNSRKQSLLENM